MQALLLTTVLLCYLLNVECDDDPLDQLRNTIPGEPGVDYPILSTIEYSEFDCQGKTLEGFMETLIQTVRDIMFAYRIPQTATRCTQSPSSVPMEPFSTKNFLPVNGGSMLTVVYPPHSTARMKACLLMM